MGGGAVHGDGAGAGSVVDAGEEVIKDAFLLTFAMVMSLIQRLSCGIPAPESGTSRRALYT